MNESARDVRSNYALTKYALTKYARTGEWKTTLYLRLLSRTIPEQIV